MTRRRLRVVCSSDEEEPPQPSSAPPTPPSRHGRIDDVIIDDIETDFQTVGINSSDTTPDTFNSTTNGGNTSVCFSSEPIPIDISDDEECLLNDQPDNHPSYRATSDSNLSTVDNYFRVSDSPVNGVLEKLGLRLRKEWLDSCLISLQSSVSGFQGMDDSSKAKLCFEQFLFSDMNFSGAGVLPPNVHTFHLVDLKGPFVLQVDEIVNISCPLRVRYQNAGPGSKRCLKLSMTDGVQRVFAMEYRPIKKLDVLDVVGLKVVILNVNIRHGLLMLVPEVLDLLGGSVDELVVARQRLVNEINKPPRGKRNRTDAVLPLATRATLAAWPPNNSSIPGHMDRTIRENATPLPGGGQENGSSIPATDRHRQVYTVPGSRKNPECLSSSASLPSERVNIVRHDNLPTSTPSQAAGRESGFSTSPMDRSVHEFVVPLRTNNTAPNSPFPIQPQEYCITPQNVDRTAGIPLEAVGRGTSFDTPVDTVFREDVVSMSTKIADPNALGFGQQEEFPQNIHEYTREVTMSVRTTGQDIPSDYTPGKDVTVPDNAEYNPSSAVDMDAEEISAANDLTPPFLFSRDRESPFTYLASLSAKWAALVDNTSVIRGKIKCFLTGVKGFQYKKRTTYELRVYVDDGSLISEVLIDHSVVQRGIGFSPLEVSSGLASSDTKQVRDMKETMKQFQIFLADFEGTMVIEMNKTSPIPVALEMTKGCSAHDAGSLLKRIKSSGSAPSSNNSNTINLSP